MYAFLELGIGVYALLFDHIFVLGRDVFIAVVRASGLTRRRAHRRQNRGVRVEHSPADVPDGRDIAGDGPAT